MSDIICEQQGKLCFITMNRVAKHNAFDNAMLTELQRAIIEAENDSTIRVIILKANGPHFSAGADLAWMQQMVDLNEQDNIKDAMVLARMMYTLYASTKPTIAMVQGAAYGGGAGLAAACDIAIGADNARFCFSEVKLGLIPAVISPYVIKAIGERAAYELLMTAQVIQASRAVELNLLQHCVPLNELLIFTIHLAETIAELPKMAVKEAKSLIRHVAGQPIDEALLLETATRIAKRRVSDEGQDGLKSFLRKKKDV